MKANVTNLSKRMVLQRGGREERKRWREERGEERDANER